MSHKIQICLERSAMHFGWVGAFKKARSRRERKRPKFACLAMKGSCFSRVGTCIFHFCTWHVNCSCVDDVSIWWQMLIFVFLSLKRWFQLNSRVVRTHFASVMTFNNREMIAETRSYIFRWLSRFRRRYVWLISLKFCGRRAANIKFPLSHLGYMSRTIKHAD